MVIHWAVSDSIAFQEASKVPALIFFLGYLLLFSAAGAQEHVIKLATLAPQGSGWYNALKAIDVEVRQATDGAVAFKIYPGGVQGDEDVVLRKIRIGQLQGGGFGGQGVSRIFADVLALEVPFLYDNYEEIDYVLEQMEDYYQEGYEEGGFVLLGWTDIGFVYLLSRKPIAGADDIKGLKVWRLEGEPVTEVLFRKIGGVTSVPLGIPDVLLGLQTNLVEVVYIPPSAGIVLQWFTRVKYITSLPIGYTLGALLIDKRVFYQLSPEQQTVLRAAAGKHLREYTLQNRRDNEEAIQVMQSQGLTLVTPSEEEVRKFKDLVDECLPELVGKAFSAGAFKLIANHLRDFRQGQRAPLR